jgi:hypothetical protein
VAYGLWTHFGGGSPGEGMLGGLDMGVVEAAEKAKADFDDQMKDRNAMQAEWEGVLEKQRGE